jgi:cyanophycin synthetase
MAEGGLAALYDPETGDLAVHDRGVRHRVCRADEIPAAMGGHAAFNVANALAAAAMAFSAGLASTSIGEALSNFRSTYEQNPGRLNLHEVGGVRIIMDYAHNPEGLRALGTLGQAIKSPTGRIIAMLSVPGDRRNEEIVAMGEVGAEFFDKLVFRETPDNRGRPGGEVIRLMTEGALAAGCTSDRILGIRKEEEAVATCLEMARPGDLVILTPTRIAAVWAQVQAYSPRGGDVSDIPASRIVEPPHG